MDTGYLLAIEPGRWTVVERHRLPLPVASLRVAGAQLEVECASEDSSGRVSERITVAQGRVREVVLVGASLLLRRNGVAAARAIAVNFDERGTNRLPAPSAETRPLRRPSRSSRAFSGRPSPGIPTQPWHLYYLGQAAWWQGRKDEAGALWSRMLAPGSFPAIPYYEYAYMASGFWRYGQGEWAERAHAEGRARRSRLGVAPGPVWLIERLFNTPYTPYRAGWDGVPGGPEERHARLVRMREIDLVSEGEDFAAALWERYFRRRGRRAEAEVEATVAGRVRADPANPLQQAARFDFVLQLTLALALALGGALAALLANALRRRRAGERRRDEGRPPALLACLRPRERRTLVAASVLSALVFASLLLTTERISGMSAMPLGLGDSFGSAAMRADLERRLSEEPSDAARFVLAVANHVAGKEGRARELYEGLRNDARARRNLTALRSGRLVPPDPVTRDDLLQAYTHAGWTRIPRRIVEAMDSVATDLFERSSLDAAAIAAFALLGVLGGGPLLVLALLLAAGLRPASPAAALEIPAPRPGAWARLVPGLVDLRRGRPARGYAALLGASLLFVALGCHAAAASRLGVGALTALHTSSVLRPFPVPDRAYWTILWTYRDAPWFWALVGVLAGVSVALHASALVASRSNPDCLIVRVGRDPDPSLRPLSGPQASDLAATLQAVPYRIEYSPETVEHLAALTSRQSAIVLDVVSRQLAHEPTVQTRHRARMRPNPIGGHRLRIGDLRVYYDVIEEPERIVVVKAVGIKVRERVFIGGEELRL